MLTFISLQIQGVPRRVLKVILSIESGNKSQKKQQQQQPAQPAKQTSTTALASATAGRHAAPALTATEASHASRLAEALSIIADESGLAVADLTDSTVFGDVGIDSLLGLTISARFKEQLDLDLDFNAFFFDYPTVGDLKILLGGGHDSATAVSTPSSSSTHTGPTSLGSPAMGASTPASSEGVPTPHVDFKRALEIVSEESGMAVGELTDDTNFADSGVDSLLSLVIVSRYRDELELDI